ncbi:MAG: hypothetical protein CVU41_10665 [Chloroflexi bacterium HGW-Chloroflexi-3]|nr:MAG: hypothetical protein CVU41_10665 [Chloroflexi bacterium HGW-Chloroflexi-3]
MIFLTACNLTTGSDKNDSGNANMPNPASVFCEENGGTLEIRTAEDGSQAGFCVFADGSECDEWAYFRGECNPGDNLTENSLPTHRIGRNTARQKALTWNNG